MTSNALASGHGGNPPITQNLNPGAMPLIKYAGEGMHGPSSGPATYRVPKEWCLHWYAYKGRVGIGDWAGEIFPGCLSLVPPGIVLRHEWQHPNSRHVFIHFRLKAKGKDANCEPGVPLWFRNPPESLTSLIKTSARTFPNDTPRAAIALWEAIHQLRELAFVPEPGPSAVGRMSDEIHKRLMEPISLATIAGAVGLSKNQANRVFRSATGESLCAYWRRKKQEQAIHLLRATDLPVKHIAADLGYTDLQQFNKLIRQHSGKSPRATRRR